MSGELGPLLSVVLRHAPTDAVRLENPEVRWWRCASVGDAHGFGPELHGFPRAQLAAEHPQAYAQLLAKLIPAELRAELEHSHDHSSDEVVAALHRGREGARRGRERAQRERPVAPEICDGNQP